jgi:peptidyl-prolyl cis-trans isomerase C
VLLTNQVAASDLRQLWAWGATYDQIVERVEEIPDAFVGQEGEFTREDLPGSFANLLFSLDVGTISDVLNTDYGFHVIQVVEHFPETQLDLGSVEDEIRRELEQKRTYEGLERLVESARERYNVRVFVRNVPFNYEGIYEQHIYKTSD